MKMLKMRNNEVVQDHVSSYFPFIFNTTFVFLLADVPQKRVDRHRSNGTNPGQSPNPNAYRSGMVGQLAEGSPLVPRRQLYSNIK